MAPLIFCVIGRKLIQVTGPFADRSVVYCLRNGPNIPYPGCHLFAAGSEESCHCPLAMQSQDRSLIRETARNCIFSFYQRWL